MWKHHQTTADQPTRALWRAAGGFALAHVVLMLAGIALAESPLFQDGTKGIQEGYVEGNMARTMAGGMVETLAFVLLIPALVFLARAVGRRTEVGRWAAQTALMAGMGYVAVTMAVGFRPAQPHCTALSTALTWTRRSPSTTSASSATSSASPAGRPRHRAVHRGQAGPDHEPLGRLGRIVHRRRAGSVSSGGGDRPAGLGHLGLAGVVGRRRCLPLAPPSGRLLGLLRTPPKRVVVPDLVPRYGGMRIARIVGVVLAGLAGVAGALTSVLLARGQGAPVNELAVLLVVSAYALVAITISLARPGHPVGRLMLVGGCIWGLGEGVLALGVRAVAHGQTTSAEWFAVVGTTARGLGWLVLILGLPLVFPDGRTPGADDAPSPSRSRPSFCSGSARSSRPARWTTGWPVWTARPVCRNRSPWSPTCSPSAACSWLPWLSSWRSSGSCRWRAGDDLVRQQLLWFCAAFAAPLLLIPFIPSPAIEPWMFGVVTLPIPVAVAVALLQRRLYDVQLVVNRTVTFVALSAVVAALYAITVEGSAPSFATAGPPGWPGSRPEWSR